VKGRKYIVRNAESVRQWLLYLFEHHPEYVRKRSGELELSTEALEAMRREGELAEVVEGGNQEVEGGGG